MAYRMKIKGKTQEDLILVGSLKRGGRITTLDRHYNWQMSLAILNEDGEIMRLQRKIGTRDDITLCGRVKAPQRKATMADGIEVLCGTLDAWCGDLPDVPVIT